MKKLLLGAVAIFLIHSGALAAPGTCTSNKNRCDGHCSAQGGSKMNWCHADCQSRWGECMQNGTWRYSDPNARTGVIYGVQKR
jgi:hypothetical protein